MGTNMPTVNEFLAVVQEISQNSKFDCGKACKRLAEQAHHIESLNHIQSYLTKPTEKVEKNTVFDGVDCANNLSELLVASTACGLADLTEKSFSQCVDKVCARLCVLGNNPLLTCARTKQSISARSLSLQ